MAWDERFIKVSEEFVTAISGIKIGPDMIEPIQAVDGSWVIPYCVLDLEGFQSYFDQFNISKNTRKAFMTWRHFPTHGNDNPQTPNYMPLVRLQQFGITRQLDVPLSNTTAADGVTVIKRNSTVSMTYDTELERVYLSIKVKHFDENDNYLGADPLYPDEDKILTADMNSVVDAETGELLGKTADLIDPVTGDLAPSIADRNVMYEYEFYRLLASSKSLVIDDLITMKVMSADADGSLYTP